MFTDAERALADSDEGRMIVAKAESEHHLRTAYRGNDAPPFTDGMAAKAIRDAVARKREAQQFVDYHASDMESLRAAADAAYQRHKLDLSTRYRQR